MRLYELTSEYARLASLIEEAGEDADTTEIEAEINKLGGTVEEKLENCARVVVNLKALADVEKAKAAPFQAVADKHSGKARALTNEADRLKKYIGICLGEGSKIKTENFSFYWGSTSAVIEKDPAKVPDQYCYPERCIDNKLLLAEKPPSLKGSIWVDKKYLVIK